MLLNRRYAILDIEGISLSKERRSEERKGAYSKIHSCLRKTAVLLYHGRTAVQEAKPCIKREALMESEEKSFSWCKENIHHLPYTPADRSSPKCSVIPQMLADFLRENRVEIVYYKGGLLEKDLCEQINIPAYNLENIGVRKADCCFHDPLKEVIFYKKELHRILN